MKHLAFVLVVLLSLFGSMASANADDAQVEAARATEARARTAFRAKRYAAAAAEFAAAFRLDPKANTKYNEGLAWGKAGKPAAEADALSEALAFGGLEVAIAAKATEALRTLKTKLGQLLIAKPVGAKVSVAHAESRSVPVAIHLVPGAHTVRVAHKDGSTEQRSITIVAGEDTRVTFQPPAAPEPAIVLPAADDTGPTGLLVFGWSSVGLGGAALIATGVVGSLTLSKVSKYDDTGNTDVALYDEAVALKTTTNALIGVGSGLVVVGAVLLIVDALQDDDGGDVSATRDGLLLRF